MSLSEDSPNTCGLTYVPVGREETTKNGAEKYLKK